MIDTEDLIPHMRRVQAAEREMRDLSLTWQMIEASAAISCPQEVQSILPTLSQTRERFDELQRRLVQQLATESLAELQGELAAKAQCAIDILVRNLYERTADVGFLATDDVLREFCRTPAEERDVAALRRRLGEYRAKYTVYDDIVVCDAGGQVLVRLDDSASLQSTGDPIVAAALRQGGYVERYAPTDLAGGACALLYAHRIEGAGGQPLGVLVLRFRFGDEMQRIFSSVADARNQMALVLIDKDRRVVATNDEGHVPVGVRMPAVRHGHVEIMSFGGRDYLAIACETRGYQGYMGPGWSAHAMVSLLTAFRTRSGTANLGVSLENDELAAIHQEADAINRNLRRVVWNGRLMGTEQSGDQVRLKAVLTQVNLAGGRTRARVDHAIEELHRTSMGRSMQQAAELARLAADIMDRNLYERANDCRWWALSPVVQRVLASPPEERADAELTAVLEHINGLYTVYSRLVAFDANGIVRAASRERPGQPLVGSRVDDSLLQAVAALGDSQRYAVTPFEPCSLSFGEPVYVYLAAVRDARNAQRAGGIAVVFNTVPELTTMLGDVLGERKGLAAFVDAAGRVLACTSADHPPGSRLPMATGEPMYEIDGAQLALAQAQATGYREFKTSDGYRNDVRAVVALHLGAVERRRSRETEEAAAAARVVDRSRSMELAVFRVGSGRYGLPAGCVSEAIAPRSILRAPNAGAAVAGLIEVTRGGRPRIVQLLSARALLGIESAARNSDGVAIVLRPTPDAPPALALWVDDVDTVVEVDAQAIQPAPGGLRQHDRLVAGLLDLRGGDEAGASSTPMIQVLDAERLLSLLVPVQRAA